MEGREGGGGKWKTGDFFLRKIEQGKYTDYYTRGRLATKSGNANSYGLDYCRLRFNIGVRISLNLHYITWACMC